MGAQIIEVRPATEPKLARAGCWQVLEGHCTQPVFPPPNALDNALRYARQRAAYAPTEIRVLDAGGNVIETIAAETEHGLV